MKKRILCFVLVFVMTLGFLPTLSVANAATYGDLTYEIHDGEVTITDCVYNATEVTIPSEIEGYPVTAIGREAFFNCSSLASITIPDSVTSIGDWAFFDCYNLSSISIPDSVTSIGKRAFYGCSGLADSDGFVIVRDILYDYCGSATSITIPDGVTTIGDWAFYRCTALVSITIPDSITSIGDSAFSGCTALASITIPDSVTSIGEWAFNTCTNLESITIPDSVTSIGKKAFYYCYNLSSISIPDSVTSIGDYAFEYCKSLESITIPDSVTSIGEGAFQSCKGLADSDGFVIVRNVLYDYYGSATSITIPDSVTTIGDGAFEYCESLVSITIPDSVTSIGDDAFYLCGNLESVTIPNSMTTIGKRAFFGCTALESITIPDSVTSIGSSAFYNTALYNNEENWQDGVLYINNYLIKAKANISGNYTIKSGTLTLAASAFHGCTALASITIPDSVTSIGEWAFNTCTNLESITIPDSVTSIGEKAFEGCGITNAAIGNNVTTIVYRTFAFCTNLASVTLPESVTAIDEGAFYDCESLSTVNYGGSEADRGNIHIVEDGNTYLLNATWNYHEHKYDNACDTDCNTCGKVRTITHTYGEYVSDNNATTEKDGTKTRTCSVCGAKDTVTDIGSKLPAPEPKPEEKPEEKPVEIKDTTKIFTDVKAKKWYTNAVNYAYSHGFIAGVSDTEFGRDVPVTRGMFITILARIAGVDTSSKANKVTTKFTDVKSGKYYTNAIKWASENGVVNGLTDTTFGPNNAIERQQLCTMIVNFAKYMEIELNASQDEIKFADATSIRKYAKNAVATCQKAGVVSGYAVDGGTEFKPLNTATRAEAAQILYKFHKDFVA